MGQSPRRPTRSERGLIFYHWINQNWFHVHLIGNMIRTDNGNWTFSNFDIYCTHLSKNKNKHVQNSLIKYFYEKSARILFSPRWRRCFLYRNGVFKLIFCRMIFFHSFFFSKTNIVFSIVNLKQKWILSLGYAVYD